MAKRRDFGTIRKLPSGRYQAKYVNPSTGRYVLAEDTFKTKTDAGLWLDAQRVTLASGTWHDPGAGKVLLREYAADWIEGRTLTPATRVNYSGLLKLHILPSLGDTNLKDITGPQIKTWYSKNVKKAPRQADAAYARLRTMLNDAVTDGMIPSNPMTVKGAGLVRATERPYIEYADFKKVSAAASAYHRKLQAEEQRRLTKLEDAHADPEKIDAARTRLAAYEHDYMPPLLAVTYGAHLRRGEVIGLHRGDYDRTKGTLRIERQVQEIGGQLVVEPKQDSKGTILLPPPVRKILDAYLDTLPTLKPSEPLFYRVRGQYLGQSHLGDRWEQARDAVGLEDVHFHDIRSASLTVFAQGGATTKEIMERGRHKTMAASLRYQKAAASREAEMVERMALLMPDGDEHE